MIAAYSSRIPRATAHRAQYGFSLIELMIAMVLGLIVSGAAVALFFSNSRTYASTESLGRIQENARAAFELMARDVLESAGNVCGTALANTANVLNDQATNWFANFNGGVRGYESTVPMLGLAFGTARGTRVRGTDAIDLSSVFSDGVTIQDHQPTSAGFFLNTVNHGLNDGDIAMACDANHAAIFQVTNAQPGTNVRVNHNSGGGVATPGNCTNGLGLPVVCSGATPGTSYEFGCAFGNTVASRPCTDPTNQWTAIIAKLRASRWYIGNDGAGRRSLFQMVRVGTADQAIEIADGVNDMQLTYLVRDGTAYVDASAVADWSQVVAVRINLDMVGQDIVGTNGQALARDFDHTVAIRNRAQ